MIDPIADLFNRIRNAQILSHSEVRVPFSKLKYEIAKVLEQEKFVEKISKVGRKTRKIIKIDLKYEDGQPAISGLKKISKLGQRLYLPVKKIKPVRGGYGVAIISTSKGLMTDKKARKQKVGGEIICEIW